MTITPATQAILPVTQEDREAFRSICLRGDSGPNIREMLNSGAWDGDSRMLELIRFRQSHPLPGAVGMREALEKAEAAQLNLVRRGAHFRNAGIKQAAALVEELSKRPTTKWGEVKTAILALVDDAPSFDDVECPQCERPALTPSATTSDATKRMEQTLGATFQATPSALSGDAGETLAKMKAILEQARDGMPAYRLARINAALAALPSHQGAGK